MGPRREPQPARALLLDDDGRPAVAVDAAGRAQDRAADERRRQPRQAAGRRAQPDPGGLLRPGGGRARRGGLARRLHRRGGAEGLAGAAGSDTPIGKDPLALFAKPSLRRDAPRIMCCDARGRELFAARRLEELDAQERPDEAARACFEKLRRDECTRNLVADGALTVAELVECARRYADKAALGSDPKSLSPRSAGRHTSVVRHVLLADDEIDALLAKRSPAMARLRRREALSALDALGPAPTRLSLLTIEAAKPDALAFAAYHAEQLRVLRALPRRPRPPALVRATLDLSPALRGRVAVGRLPLEDACRYTAADRARAEQALQRKRTAMRLEDFSRRALRPAAVAAARPVPVLGAFWGAQTRSATRRFETPPGGSGSAISRRRSATAVQCSA